MPSLGKELLLVAIVCLFSLGLCWDGDDLELFDLVEEINQDFYQVMGLERTASSSDIRRAYRKLSLQYHPDKNKEENAEEKFRQIVAIADVLKDEQKRLKYNEVLDNGLPDWRQPVYYYRRVRKMGLLELLVFLFILITIGQYLFHWSAYWEKKYELEEIFSSRLKKIEKKNKKLKLPTNQSVSDLMSEELELLQKPSYRNLLPFQLIYFTIFCVKNIHLAPFYIHEKINDMKKSEVIESDYSTDDENTEERIRKPRKRHNNELPDFTGMESTEDDSQDVESNTKFENITSNKKSTEWVESDNIMLTKAMKKFPGGCSGRWDKISEMMNKPVNEVTKMAKKMKSSSYTASVPTAVQGLTGIKETKLTNDTTKPENDNLRVRKPKDLIGKHVEITSNYINIDEESSKLSVDSNWSQPQQRALELALQQYPKGTEERWDKIAACVSGKYKEECMIRFKFIAEMVKKKKCLKVS